MPHGFIHRLYLSIIHGQRDVTHECTTIEKLVLWRGPTTYMHLPANIFSVRDVHPPLVKT